MARWEPGARDRMQQAAMELFVEQGYEQTTVSQIAERAGVTDRTYFRHFCDKREVLFAGTEHLFALFTGAVADSQAQDPLAIATEALHAAAEFFPQERLPWARVRWELISTNPALAEREQLKMVTLAAALATALRERGFTEPAASLLGHSTITVFQVSFDVWLREGDDRGIREVQRETFETLRATLSSR